MVRCLLPLCFSFVMLPLFVYGTLKPGKSNYASFLAGRTVAEQPASLAGAALFTHGPYPYLVIDSGLVETYDQVSGTLLTIHPALYCEVLNRIDWLEGYRPGCSSSEYQRLARAVQTIQGPVEAWLYVAGPPVLVAIRRGVLVKIVGGVWYGA